MKKDIQQLVKKWQALKLNKKVKQLEVELHVVISKRTMNSLTFPKNSLTFPFTGRQKLPNFPGFPKRRQPCSTFRTIRYVCFWIFHTMSTLSKVVDPLCGGPVGREATRPKTNRPRIRPQCEESSTRNPQPQPARTFSKHSFYHYTGLIVFDRSSSTQWLSSDRSRRTFRTSNYRVSSGFEGAKKWAISRSPDLVSPIFRNSSVEFFTKFAQNTEK